MLFRMIRKEISLRYFCPSYSPVRFRAGLLGKAPELADRDEAFRVGAGIRARLAPAG